MAAVLRVMREQLPTFQMQKQAINCHHNYVERENHFGATVWVTRKGAVRAGDGDLGIIPGSMGAKSYIVRGKGNAESFSVVLARRRAEDVARRGQAAIHAGRSRRGDSRRRVPQGPGVIDETPMAYKDIDAVMAAQADLVEIVHTLRQVVCVKG